jgi:DNA (cytosine-5)-methyltransferase 1
MKHGSLFSGIGGFDLAAEWMGWENVFHCEWNEFGQKVLHHYWPNAETFTDITKSDFTKYANKIDILTGGFPCQPYSQAGQRKGKEDERHLWPEMLRAIREIKPKYIVGENVRGLTNWNGGLVFDEVCTELENLGYQVAPVIIPACGVGAPHRRERVWFVAYAYGSNQAYNRRANDRETEKVWRQNPCDVSGEFRSNRDVTDAESSGISEQQGSYRERQNRQLSNNGESGDAANASSRRISRYRGESENGKFQTNESNKNDSEKFRRMDWEMFPTQSPICGGDDGISNRLDGITFSKWRNESIKAYGNAIVPQVAYEIFKAIQRTI